MADLGFFFSGEKAIEKFELDGILPKQGLSTWAAIFFVIGNILGAGLVAIPYGARLASWYSIPLLGVISLSCALCGILLAKSVILSQGTEGGKSKEVSREPYPELARNAVGDKTRVLVVVTLYIAQVMACLVFLLLAGEILSKLVPIKVAHVSAHNTLRVWISITVAFLIPFNLLGSPKDFWGIAVLATVTSIATALCMFACLGMIKHAHVVKVEYPKTTAENFFASFGIFVFAFSGVGIFPTVQGDMKEPQKFVKVVAAGFGTLSVVYIAVTLSSYIVLGRLVGEDLLTSFAGLSIYKQSITFKVLVSICQVLILGHVSSAFVLQMNPIYQLVESYFKAPTGKISLNFGPRDCAKFITLHGLGTRKIVAKISSRPV